MAASLVQQILEKIGPLSTPERRVYVVGGAVRDMLLDRPVHDLDFAVAGATRPVAKEAACRLNGALYVLDEARDTTRVVIQQEDGRRVMLDFAALRGADLESDLRGRDFTVNAMAFDAAQPDRLIDPTGGLSDLREKRLRACSEGSFQEDPARVLRLVRQALGLRMRIDPPTLGLARAAAALLPRISSERVRDELFRMLDGSQVALGVRLLDMLGALPYVLPELCAMKGVTQSEPHTEDVWEHTLQVTQALEQLYGPLVGRYDEGAVADLTVGSAVLWLGRYREKLEAHYAHHLVPDRSPRALLFLGAMFHDVGKPGTRVETVEGRVRFLEHPELGQKIMDTRARGLALSAAEVERLVTMVGQHMRVHFLAQPLQADGQDHPSRKAMYRFFQSSGPAGVDICLLSLADLRGTYGVTLPQDTWQVELQTCQALLEAYWEKSEEIVTPPRLLSGDDLMRIYDMEPGRQVGRLLAAIREGQAAGEITSRAEAEAFAARWIERSHLNHPPSGDEGDQ